LKEGQDLVAQQMIERFNQEALAGTGSESPSKIGNETFSVRVEIIEGWVRIYLLSGTTW